MASAAEKARWQLSPSRWKNSTSNDDAERADQVSALLPTTAVSVEVVSNTAVRPLSVSPERPTKGARSIVMQEYRAELRHWVEVASVAKVKLEALKDAFDVFALPHETESERTHARDRAHNLAASLEAKAAAADVSNQAVTAREYTDMSNTIKIVEERLQKNSVHDEDTVKALKAQLCNAEAELLTLRQKIKSDGAEMVTLRQKIDSDGEALDALARLTCHVSTLATPQLQQHRETEQEYVKGRQLFKEQGDGTVDSDSDVEMSEYVLTGTVDGNRPCCNFF